MIDLLQIYQWTLIAAIFSGAALALIGSQLAARQQAVQSFVISQSASLGLLLGFVIEIFFFHGEIHGSSFLPTLTSILSCLFIYYLCEFVILPATPSRNTYHLVLYSILLAIAHTLTTLIPGLDSHLTASYLGDLSLASDAESIGTAIASVLVLSFVWVKWPAITAWSFQTSLFALHSPHRSEKKTQALFVFFSLCLISLSVHILGLLYTISCLFIPVAVLRFVHLPHAFLRLLLALVSGASVALGFILSLTYPEIPTVPCISLSLLCVSLGVLYFARKGLG